MDPAVLPHKNSTRIAEVKEVLVATIKDWISKKESVEKETITIFADDRRFRVPLCRIFFLFNMLLVQRILSLQHAKKQIGKRQLESG